MRELKSLLVLPAVQNIEEIIAGLAYPVEMTKAKFRDLEFHFTNFTTKISLDGIDIKGFDNVWLSSFWGSRDLAYTVKLYLDHNFTKHTFVEQATSKVTDQMIFALSNISIPNTFFVDNADITAFIDPIEATCGYPLIIKDITGAAGKLSVYINDRIELLQRAPNLPKHKKYLFQKFIPNDYDWGVIVANGEVVSAERSYPQAGEFRNNCNGATEVFSEIAAIPELIKNMAIQASAALGLNWSRSDIVVDRNSEIAYLMEVNRSPGISTGTMEVTAARSFLANELQEETQIQVYKEMTTIFYREEVSDNN
jgi:glutathione synthase/RimK-type ligase-like ATP-grasp enzyme